jgi:hypothetical protein
VRDNHYLVAVGALQQFRNDGSAQMAAGTTNTDFHVNLQYFSNEQIQFPATFAVISITGFTARVRLQPLGKESADSVKRLCCRLQSSAARGKPMWHAHPHTKLA